MNKSTLTVIIIAFNEEVHIARAISSALSIADRVVVVDSGSTDKTVQFAKDLGADVYFNTWVNHAHQVNWALDNCSIGTDWVMRIDADEYLTDELASEIRGLLSSNSFETHYYIKRRVFFMNRWIKFGGYYPVWLLRLWRGDVNARCEARWMDEHMKVEGGCAGRLHYDLVDHNLNDLTWWTNKHNRYATQEAVEILNTIYRFSKGDQVTPKLFGAQAERKRLLKLWYVKLPLFIRPAFYFLYRYLFRLGFLDGMPGLVWHCLQGGWYRFLVDAKVAELYCQVGREPDDVLRYIRSKWGIPLEK